jgi:cell division protein FtsB
MAATDMTSEHAAPLTPADPPPTPGRARDRKRVRSSAPEVRERRRRLVRYALLIVSGVLMVNALVGERGYLANMQARQDQQRLDARLDELRQESEALKERARRLREDPRTLEEAAREHLGLIRPGETLITIRDRKKD